MSKRKDKINRKIREEQAEIERLKWEITRLKIFAAECDADGNEHEEHNALANIRSAEERIERLKKQIEGKEEVRDDANDEASTRELIEKEVAELDKKIKEKEDLKSKGQLTPEDEETLKRLKKECAEDGNKIKGKIEAGKAADEIPKSAMVPGATPGPYKVAVLDPLGREILAFSLPGPAGGTPAILSGDEGKSPVAHSGDG